MGRVTEKELRIKSREKLAKKRVENCTIIHLERPKIDVSALMSIVPTECSYDHTVA